MLKKVVANYIAKIFSLFSLYLFTPLYVKYLGVESYGIVGFYGVVFSLLSLIDSGFSVSTISEFAYKATDKKNQKRKWQYLVTVERVYVAFSIVSFLIFSFGAYWFAKNWFNSPPESIEILGQCIVLMALISCLQLFINLYNGALIGLEKQVESSLYQIIFGVLKNGVVVLVIVVHPSIVIFFGWQILISSLHLLVLKIHLSRFERNCAYATELLTSIELLRNQWRYIFGMFLVSLISAINLQVDKLIITKLLPFEEYSIYSIASIFSQIGVFISVPILLAYSPRFMRISRIKGIMDIKKRLIFSVTKYISILTGLYFTMICFHKESLLNIMFVDEGLRLRLAPLIIPLVLGSVFFAYQTVPFNVAIAHKSTRIVVSYGVASIVFTSICYYFLILSYGLQGAVYSWLGYFFISTPLFSYFVFLKFMKGTFFEWILKSCYLPFALIISTYFAIYIVSEDYLEWYLQMLLGGGVIGFVLFRTILLDEFKYVTKAIFK